MPRPRRLAKPIDGVLAFQDATAVTALATAWERVWRNGGAAGGDGMPLKHFAMQANQRIAELSRALRGGGYRPGLLRVTHIPKPGGGQRKLTIPSVIDRVAQTAVAQTLGPLLDAEMEDASFGYRPGRSVGDAVKRVEKLRREGFVWTVDADIDDFFDTIPVDGLMARLARSLTASPLTDLIALWLEQGAALGRGVAQGSPLSPLLANLYLDDLDEELSGGGLRIVRYADDFLVMARDRPAAEAGLARTAKILARHGLKLDADKTQLRSYDETMRFLGHVFVRGWAMPSPEREDGAPEGRAETLLRQVAERDKAEELALTSAARGEAEEGRGGLDRGMRLLHLREPGRKLTLRNEGFSVVESDEEAGSGKPSELAAIHPSRLDRIEIGPRIEVDHETLRQALAYAIPVAFVSGRGETIGHLAPALAPRADRHLAQARHALDPELRLKLALRIVEGRIANQRSLLRRVNHRRGLIEAANAAAKIGRVILKLTIARSVEQAMGVEGEAAKLFWRGWGALLLNGFSFGPRKRRISADPANIVLDVCSGLLARDISAVCLSTGLHPGFGVLHSAGGGRDACVYDLMEEFRAGLIESLALALINTNALNMEMFSRLEDGTCRMGRAGMGVIIRGYEERCERAVTSVRSGKRVAWRRLMREQAEAYAAHVEGRADYKPYVLDN